MPESESPADRIAPSGTCDAGRRLLARLESRRPLAPSERVALIEGVRAALARESAHRRSAGSGLDLQRQALQLAKWRAIHTFLHKTPYRDRASQSRSQQWSAALDRIRELSEPELIDWVALQIEVARNLERGVQDMRPRKNGPTFLVMLEHVANRKRKALAVLKWMRDADRDGYHCVDGEFHAETRRILLQYGIRDFDAAGSMIPADDPLVRI